MPSRTTPSASVANLLLGDAKSNADPPLVGTKRSAFSMDAAPASSTVKPLVASPSKRYIGAFGAVGWATRSGTGLIKHEEQLNIERAKIQPKHTKIGRGSRAKVMLSKKQDIVVRFTNARGDEVGRLENESAAWVSTLIDQKTCFFEGRCVYAPERLRTSETIYLQLRCYLLPSAFEKNLFSKVDKHQGRYLEIQENQDERELRLRQIALVKLFEAISLLPSRGSSATNARNRRGLLQAAETGDQGDSKTSTKSQTHAAAGGSTPPSEEAEEGQELEQDQLDSLYKKAQSFDFNTPELHPADSFAMSLRKYQKQALHWMVGKEKDAEFQHRQASMHPLWEEYQWPVQDVDGAELSVVAEQPAFYVNPYSGELSLEFPKQEQHCLGGILADGTLLSSHACA